MYSQFNQKIPLYWEKAKVWTQNTWSELQTKNWTKRELLILFVLACMLGMASKAVAVRTVTIGYEDYLITKEGSVPFVPSHAEPLQGPVCEE